MYAGMRGVGVVAGWLAGPHKHRHRFRERSEEKLLEDPRDYVPNVAELPPPTPGRSNKRGNVHEYPPMTRTRARIRGGHAEGAEVTEGRRGRRTAEDADVEKRGTMGGNTTSHCLESEDRSGEAAFTSTRIKTRLSLNTRRTLRSADPARG